MPKMLMRRASHCHLHPSFNLRPDLPNKHLREPRQSPSIVYFSEAALDARLVVNMSCFRGAARITGFSYNVPRHTGILHDSSLQSLRCRPPSLLCHALHGFDFSASEAIRHRFISSFNSVTSSSR